MLAPDSLAGALQSTGTTGSQAGGILLEGLNRLVQDPGFWAAGLFSKVALRKATRELLARSPAGIGRIHLNRLLLEDLLHGGISAAPESNVKVRYEMGGGLAGNVGKGSAFEGDVACEGSAHDYRVGLRGETVVDGEGGSEPETLDAARDRAAALVKNLHRAVTPADFVSLATTTTNVAIARAYAAVGYHPYHPCTIVPGAVTVFVVPHAPRDDDWVGAGESAPASAPIADPGALEELRRRFDRARLIGTEVFVRSAAYRKARILIEVGGDPPDPQALRWRITEAIRRYLDPLIGGDDSKGWPFGEPLRRSAILGKAEEAVESGEAEVVSVAIGLDGVEPVNDCADRAIERHELVDLDQVFVRIERTIDRRGGMR
jgi:hypothetical protein